MALSNEPAVEPMDGFSEQRIRHLFARHGIRCTKQREEIYKALAMTKSHPTAEELYMQVKESASGLSLATIYNTLDVFSEKGLCRRLTPSHHNPAAPCRYDADVSPHLHLILNDGQVRDIPEKLGEKLLAHIPDEVIEEIESSLGVQVGRMNIEFICEDSQESSESR